MALKKNSLCFIHTHFEKKTEVLSSFVRYIYYAMTNKNTRICDL